MSVKPVVLVTRKLPPAVEDRLRRDYQARLNPDDRLYSKDELIEQARARRRSCPVTPSTSRRTSSSDCPPRSKSSPTSRSASTTWTSRRPEKRASS